MIEGSDGTLYPFTEREWTEEEQPEVDGLVLVICPNGRDASQVEYRGIEHMPFLKITTHSEAGETQTMSHTRFIGGPWRMRSDALAWMEVAKGLHRQFSHIDIEDISELLRGEHLLISLRGSVIKYCYGIAIELYLKWILTEANIDYGPNHQLRQLIRKLPSPVLERLRSIYSEYRNRHSPDFRMMEANKDGVERLDLDWSTFDAFIGNLVKQKFIVGRYATPSDYSFFQSLSAHRSHEMNSYMDSDDFIALGDAILTYMPDPSDYE